MKTKKDEIEHIQSLTSNLLQKSVSVSFGAHQDTAILLEVKKATASGKNATLNNTPDKRLEDGKAYTPQCILLVFENFSLALVIEDTRVDQLIGGIRFTIGSEIVEIRIAS